MSENPYQSPSQPLTDPSRTGSKRTGHAGAGLSKRFKKSVAVCRFLMLGSLSFINVIIFGMLVALFTTAMKGISLPDPIEHFLYLIIVIGSIASPLIAALSALILSFIVFRKPGPLKFGLSAFIPLATLVELPLIYLVATGFSPTGNRGDSFSFLRLHVLVILWVLLVNSKAIGCLKYQGDSSHNYSIDITGRK